MNGLEAIELMKQGKMVVEVGTSEPFVLKIENGIVLSKSTIVSDGKWGVDDCFDFTVNYEEYIEPKPLTGWERVGENESYYHISCNCYVAKLIEERCMEDKYYHEDANYFSTEEKAEEIDFKQTLFRKLQRFSDENGGNEIDWNNFDQPKYYIKYFCYDSQKIRVECICTVRDFGQVYFVSEEVTKKAIELFLDDLIKYFTHDWGGENE